jgi:hypothetical protein
VVCITPEPDGACRPGFSARFEFKEKRGDTRTCTACECGAPVDGRCVADVLLFGDTGCSDHIVSISGIGTHDTPCADTPANSPLAATRVILAEKEPGTCMPTSGISRLEGDLVDGASRVFCCSESRLVEGR